MPYLENVFSPDGSYIGTMKILASRCTDIGDGYSDHGTFLNHVVVKNIEPGRDIKDVADAIRALDDRRCYHEYDCCGCSFTMTKVKRVGRRELFVRTRVLRNY